MHLYFIIYVFYIFMFTVTLLVIMLYLTSIILYMVNNFINFAFEMHLSYSLKMGL